MGEGGVCTQRRTWLSVLSSAFVGLTPHAQPFRASPSVPCWTVFGTRRVWRGVFRNPASPHSRRASTPGPECSPALPPLCLDLPMWAAQVGKSDAHFAFFSRFLFVVLSNFGNWILHPDYRWTFIPKVSSSLVSSKASRGLRGVSVMKDVLNGKFKMKKNPDVLKTNHSINSNTCVNTLGFSVHWIGFSRMG